MPQRGVVTSWHCLDGQLTGSVDAICCCNTSPATVLHASYTELMQGVTVMLSCQQPCSVPLVECDNCKWHLSGPSSSNIPKP